MAMASIEYFDNVKAEKEDALWRYNMERKMRVGVRYGGFLLVLFLLSWSWFPSLVPHAVAVAGDYLRRLVGAFNKPFFTFILVNIIVFAVYLLSGSKQSSQEPARFDLYDEYVSSRRSSVPASAVSADATTSHDTEETMVDKQIVLVENAVAVSQAKQQRATVETVTETNRSVSPVKQQGTMNRTVVTKTAEVNTKELYRRSRSMVSESRRWPKEFRRSETAISRELVVVSGGEPPRKSMDEMSSEEFQSIIDSFIAERKRTLMQENTAHYTRRKEKCMPIVVKN